MRKFTYLMKTLLISALFLVANSAWGQTITRTWDFTDNTSWNTIAAAAGDVYYSTDGTSATSAAFDASTAVKMNATGEFTMTADKGYAIGGYSTTKTDNVPSKDFMSVIVPAGYTLRVTGSLAGGVNYSNSFYVVVGNTVCYLYNSSKDTEKEYAYKNNTGDVVTVYLFTPSTYTSRRLQIKNIILTNVADELTAITSNRTWNFVQSGTVKCTGTIMDDIYMGNGLYLRSGYYFDFGGNGDTTTGDFTVQMKIPSNHAIGIILNAGGTNGRPTLLTDESSYEYGRINTDNANSGKDTPFFVQSSESERTLYIYTSSYKEKTTYIKTIKLYANYPVSISSAGWATLYTPFPLDFSGVEGLTAYTATLDGSEVTLTEVTNVPANTGVVLKGSEGDYNIPIINASSTPQGSLQGSATEATAYDAVDGYTLYILALNDEDKAQFFPTNEGEIAAGKAYLPVPIGELAKALRVVIEGETTEVTTPVVSEIEEPEVLVNLAGIPVGKDYKGIVINQKGEKRLQK